MELKEKLKEVIKDTIQTVTDKELREEVMQKVSDSIQKTKEYIDENRLMPGAKDEYIAQLEQELDEKERENEQLRRILKKRNWTGR